MVKRSSYFSIALPSLKRSGFVQQNEALCFTAVGWFVWKHLRPLANGLLPLPFQRKMPHRHRGVNNFFASLAAGLFTFLFLAGENVHFVSCVHQKH
jgi:hypothetical protein